MRLLPRLLALLLLMGAGAGCGEYGAKAIAYGDGLGEDWTPPPEGKQMRIAVENYFTRTILVYANAPGLHYELTVRPIRKRYMIIPEAEYTITATTDERSTGGNYLYVSPEERNGAKCLHVKIRF